MSVFRSRIQCHLHEEAEQYFKIKKKNTRQIVLKICASRVNSVVVGAVEACKKRQHSKATRRKKRRRQAATEDGERIFFRNSRQLIEFGLFSLVGLSLASPELMKQNSNYIS